MEHKRDPSAGTQGQEAAPPSPLLPVSWAPNGQTLAKPNLEQIRSLNCGAEIAEPDFAGGQRAFQSSTEYQNLEPVFPWPPPLGFVPAVTKWLLLSLGTLVCYTLQSFLMLVSLLEGTTSAENRFGKARLHNRLPQSTPKVSLQTPCHSALPLTQVYLNFWL